MSISTDSLIEFFGTQDEVSAAGGTAAVTDGSFSAASDGVTGGWTNDDDAPLAAMVLQAAYASAPTAHTTVDLFARLMDVESTHDQDTPDGNFEHHYMGSFPLNDVTTTQRIPLSVTLPNVSSGQVYEFYIRNNAGQSLSAGWKLFITPKTYGPHA